MADEINDNEENEETTPAATAENTEKLEHQPHTRDDSQESVGLLERRTVVPSNGRRTVSEAKLDKAVSTNDTLLDLQRALTYEAVFSTLIENKMLAMKREYEERKRAKCIKRRLMGRILLTKKLFGAGRSARVGSGTDVNSLTALDGSEQLQQVQQHYGGSQTDMTISKFGRVQSLRREEMPFTSAVTTATSTTQTMAINPETPVNAEDSLASTLSNSSGKHIEVKRNLLVQAQTHTHTPVELTTSTSTSASVDLSKPDALARRTPITNGSGQMTVLPEQIYDISSLASGYENGGVTTTITRGAVHTSTMADDSLTSLRGSLESLSFASSRGTVSFGGTEIIPEDTESLQYERERARVTKRMRILEAKSISAQCSPILPRNITMRPAATNEISQLARGNMSYQRTIPSNHAYAPVLPVEPVVAHTYDSAVQPLRASSTDSISLNRTNKQITTKFPAQTHYAVAPAEHIDKSKYISDSVNVNRQTRYALNFSRQNTSEDSANLTVSTLLNQSDSFSLNAPPSYANVAAAAAVIGVSCGLALSDRYKSKSTSLLVNGHTRPQSAIIIPIDDHAKLHDNVDAQTTHNLRYNDRSLVLVDNSCSSLRNVPVNAQQKPDPKQKQAASDTIVNITELTQKTDAMMQRIASTSTGSSVTPTRCCATAKTTARERDMPLAMQCVRAGQSVSDDEYKRHKRKYKRYHRCSDPILVTKLAGAFQTCQPGIMQSEMITTQYPQNEEWTYDLEAIEAADLDEIVPSGHHHHHRKHHHRRHKKRRRHKKPKIIVQDLETQVVKVIDPHDLSKRARWTIIATACLLLLMCLMLVGITLRMAPIIDDMGKWFCHIYF